MAESNNDFLAFNLYKIKGKARRIGRRDSSGSSKWSPFRLIDHSSPKRRNTASDAENGLAPDETESGKLGLKHSSTAPERLHTPIHEEPRTSKEEEVGPSQQTLGSTFDSQASAAESSANGVMRNRKNGAIEDEPNAMTDEPEKIKKKKTGFLKHIVPKEPFTVRNQLQRTFLNSWINVLLIAAPVGIALAEIGIDGKIVFAVNFVAIIPLAAMLSFATEEIALRTGETLGGLINATFGNAVELIVAIMALLKDEVAIVQTSLIGSILSNLLLVLGMCFFCGGLNRKVQFFNKTVAQTAASLLALAVASVIVPTVFEENTRFPDKSHVANLSRGVSIILLVVYSAYLFFQLKTHSKFFSESSQKAEKVPWRKRSEEEGIEALAKAGGRVGAVASGHANMRDESGKPMDLLNLHPKADMEDDDDEEEPELAFWVAVATLAISTIIIAFCAEFMVDGISSITEEGVSKEFVGLILLPIVGNAAEHATAVAVAIKDKMDLAIGVAVGSSMQVALFLIPLLVIIGWGRGMDDMSLAFDSFQVAVLFVSVLLVNYLIADGESHWLEGLLLVCLYFIIAVCSWWYPAKAEAAG